MDKKNLREQGLMRLKQLNPVIKQEKEKLISALLFASKEWQEAETVGIIRSLPFEFDTKPIFEQGFSSEKKLAVPISAEKRLTFFQVDSQTEYRTSSFGVEEPLSQGVIDSLDLLIVPGLIFSREGYRIGFGGGFYDRFLADFQGNTVSLVFSEQFDETWQPETFDIPVQKIITDKIAIDKEYINE
jgi:5-formyltetrahydrofolate cyclo-ligase